MNRTPFDINHPSTERLISQLTHPIYFKLYCLRKLPMAWFAGMTVQHISMKEIRVRLPFRWSTKNPFRSVYFAAQTAAAELSTGLAILLPVQQAGNISMLVTSVEAGFMRKAKSNLQFKCTEVEEAVDLVQKAIDTGEGQTRMLRSEGVDEEGNVVSEFFFEWSVKIKSS